MLRREFLSKSKNILSKYFYLLSFETILLSIPQNFISSTNTKIQSVLKELKNNQSLLAVFVKNLTGKEPKIQEVTKARGEILVKSNLSERIWNLLLHLQNKRREISPFFIVNNKQASITKDQSLTIIKALKGEKIHFNDFINKTINITYEASNSFHASFANQIKKKLRKQKISTKISPMNSTEFWTSWKEKHSFFIMDWEHHEDNYDRVAAAMFSPHSSYKIGSTSTNSPSISMEAFRHNLECSAIPWNRV